MTSKAGAKWLEVLKPGDSGFEKAWDSLRARQAVQPPDSQVSDVIERMSQIRAGGDRALRAWTRSARGLDFDRFELPQEEWDLACESVDASDRAALGKAAMRIREFQRKRVPSSWEMREEGGGSMGQRVRPLSRVAIVASAEGLMTATDLIMKASPASAVEVPEILFAAPTDSEGRIPPELLMAAKIAGVHRVYKLAGPEAVAAFAYGTGDLPRVDKVVLGEGAELEIARNALSGVVGFCGDSGPREMCLIADKGAQPAWVAADLLAHAESDARAQTILITHLKGLVTKVQDQLVRQMKNRDESGRVEQSLATAGTAILTPNLETSLALAEAYAPEKLVLAVESPESVAKTVLNAGEIFMGHYTPPAVGAYLAGPATYRGGGGRARFESGLGIEDFLKRTHFVKFEPPKLRELGAETVRLAELAARPGHGNSVELRLQKIRRARREREQAREAEL